MLCPSGGGQSVRHSSQAYVVDVFLHDMLDEVLEYSDDYPLEGGSDILQSEGHDLVAKIPRLVVNAVLSLSGRYIFIWM